VEPKKVLVVDDSKLIHKMFEMMLRPYQLVHAMDGQEGLTALASDPDIDLILLDINMPVMNGLEFLEEVRRNAAFKQIPVIVVSTEGKEEDTERAMAAGADSYVTKPFQSQDVLAVIERLEARDLS
jgi:two-component system chemotaxis response regulator CheY